MIITDLFESHQQCPECGGPAFTDLVLAEKKDACYYKVKASAKVWPSAYASGRLVQCRKKGASNYGNKSEGVAEGSGQKPTITYKDLTLQYDYQTEDDDPEGYSTATTYYFDVFKDGKRVGEAEYFDYFGNLKIRINGKTKEFGFRHPLASQISQLVSSLPDEQKKDLSDPRFESQGVAEMDSQQPTGRIKPDGTRSHSTYGSRDHYNLGDPETTLGLDSVLTAKDVAKKASQTLDKAFDKSHKKGMAEGSLEEYGDTAKGQKMLAKVHHRAADRVTSKQADKDPAYARKAQQTQDRAWDRLAVKEQGVAEEQDPVAAFLARGGQVQQGKLHKPRKGELWQGSSHIGAAGGRGSKGRVTGLAANTNPKGGKPVVSAESADSGEYDYEGDMAKDDLQTMVRAARRLNGMLDDNENMPEWVQSKINKAADYVDTAADYIESNQDEQGAAGGLNEFSPPGSNDGGDDGFSEETLKRLASQWYNGDEDPRVERTLMAAGWEIGQDEGYDDEPGVFVVQAGDINGNSYISWPAHELKQGVAEGKPEKPEPPKADYGPDYQDMVARVKKLAGLGPLKTVYDPKKRVYRNVPVAQQPNKK